MRKRLSPKQLVDNVKDCNDSAAAIIEHEADATGIVNLLYREARNFCQPGSAGLVQHHLDEVNKRLASILTLTEDILYMPTDQDDEEPEA